MGWKIDLLFKGDYRTVLEHKILLYAISTTFSKRATELVSCNHFTRMLDNNSTAQSAKRIPFLQKNY